MISLILSQLFFGGSAIGAADFQLSMLPKTAPDRHWLDYSSVLRIR